LKKRFIDSNIFVYVLSADPRFSQKALIILEDAEKGLYDAYTSTLVVSQVLAHLERRHRKKALTLFLKYLEESPIVVIETTFTDYLEAKRIANTYNLNFTKLWDDLVITAQMKRINVNEIYSNDKDFDEIPGVKRIF